MSSINPHFTFEYSQPGEYSFSHDSVFLARRVFEIFQRRGRGPEQGLDLCAGCGIIGLDFLFHIQQQTFFLPPKSFDFLEVQQVYADHFGRNSKKLDLSTAVEFICGNYDQLQESHYRKKYDLILCNPPYFHAGQGKLSPSEFKNRCRFFLDSNFRNLILGVANALTVGGEAYLLVREQKAHGWSALLELEKILPRTFLVEILDDIRGTDLVKIVKTEVTDG